MWLCTRHGALRGLRSTATRAKTPTRVVQCGCVQRGATMARRADSAIMRQYSIKKCLGTLCALMPRPKHVSTGGRDRTSRPMLCRPSRPSAPQLKPTSPAHAHNCSQYTCWQWGREVRLERTIWCRRRGSEPGHTSALVADAGGKSDDELLGWRLTCCNPWLEPRHTHGDHGVGLRSTQDHPCTCNGQRTRSLLR